jgi:hypothetical protein
MSFLSIYRACLYTGRRILVSEIAGLAAPAPQQRTRISFSEEQPRIAAPRNRPNQSLAGRDREDGLVTEAGVDIELPDARWRRGCAV